MSARARVGDGALIEEFGQERLRHVQQVRSLLRGQLMEDNSPPLDDLLRSGHTPYLSHPIISISAARRAVDYIRIARMRSATTYRRIGGVRIYLVRSRTTRPILIRRAQ